MTRHRYHVSWTVRVKLKTLCSKQEKEQFFIGLQRVLMYDQLYIMERQRTRQEASETLLRRTNYIFLIAAFPFLFMALTLAGSTALFRFTSCYLVLLVIGAFVISVRSILSKLPLLMYGEGILAGVLCVLAIALWGFYDPAVAVLNSTTLQPDKSFGNAITYAFVGPEALTTTRLFACGTTNGPACTRLQGIVSTTLDYSILVSGVLTGSVLARRKLRLMESTRWY